MAESDREALEATLKQHHSEADFHTAAEVLLEGYGGELIGYLSRVHADADVAAEVFGRFTEAMWTALPRFEGRSSFRTWSYAIARACSARYLRDPHRRRGERLITDALADLEANVRERTRVYLRTEVKDAVAELREQLDPADRTLLVLRVDRAMGWRDVALVMADDVDQSDERALKRHAARLRKRFERVKERLRELADDAGLLEPEA